MLAGVFIMVHASKIKMQVYLSDSREGLSLLCRTRPNFHMEGCYPCVMHPLSGPGSGTVLLPAALLCNTTGIAVQRALALPALRLGAHCFEVLFGQGVALRSHSAC